MGGRKGLFRASQTRCWRFSRRPSLRTHQAQALPAVRLGQRRNDRFNEIAVVTVGDRDFGQRRQPIALAFLGDVLSTIRGQDDDFTDFSVGIVDHGVIVFPRL